jgi:hypothetical protein
MALSLRTFLAAYLFTISSLTGATTPSTYLKVSSDTNEPRLGGYSAFLTEADGTFILNREFESNQLIVNFNGSDGKPDFVLVFKNAEGEPFATGSYIDTLATQSSPLLLPTLEFNTTVTAVSCQARGEFYVHEIAPEATPPRYAIDLIQWCENSNHRVQAALRYNSDIPEFVTLVAAVPTIGGTLSEQQQILLDATDSYAENQDITQYQWIQTHGPEAQIENPDAATTTTLRATLWWKRARLCTDSHR